MARIRTSAAASSAHRSTCIIHTHGHKTAAAPVCTGIAMVLSSRCARAARSDLKVLGWVVVLTMLL